MSFDEERQRLKSEIERLKQSNAHLSSKRQTYKISLIATVSVVVPLFAMLLLKGFLVMPGSRPIPVADTLTVEKIQYRDTLYLYGTPSALAQLPQIYCVAIGAFAGQDLKPFEANLTNNVRQTSYNSVNQIALGLFDNEAGALQLLAYLKKIGFSDAYVRKVENGERFTKVDLPLGADSLIVQPDSTEAGM